jgi:hypothetical protein
MNMDVKLFLELFLIRFQTNRLIYFMNLPWARSKMFDQELNVLNLSGFWSTLFVFFILPVCFFSERRKPCHQLAGAQQLIILFFDPTLWITCLWLVIEDQSRLFTLHQRMEFRHCLFLI